MKNDWEFWNQWAGKLLLTHNLGQGRADGVCKGVSREGGYVGISSTY